MFHLKVGVLQPFSSVCNRRGRKAHYEAAGEEQGWCLLPPNICKAFDGSDYLKIISHIICSLPAARMLYNVFNSIEQHCSHWPMSHSEVDEELNCMLPHSTESQGKWMTASLQKPGCLRWKCQTRVVLNLRTGSFQTWLSMMKSFQLNHEGIPQQRLILNVCVRTNAGRL